MKELEREEKREQLRQDALAEWADYRTTGLHLTAGEAAAWLAKARSGQETEVIPTGPAGCDPPPQVSGPKIWDYAALPV